MKENTLNSGGVSKRLTCSVWTFGLNELCKQVRVWTLQIRQWRQFHLLEMILNLSNTFERLASTYLLGIIWNAKYSSLITKPAPPTLVVLLQHFQFHCFRMQGSFPLWWIGALQNGCLFNQKQHNVPPLKSQSTVKYHLVFSPCATQVPRQPPGANTIPTARQQHSYQTHTEKVKDWPYHNKILD